MFRLTHTEKLVRQLQRMLTQGPDLPAQADDNFWTPTVPHDYSGQFVLRLTYRDGMVVHLVTEDIPTDDFAKKTGRSESGSAQGLWFDLIRHKRNGTWTLCLRDGDGVLYRFWNDIDPTELHRLLHIIQDSLMQTSL